MKKLNKPFFIYLDKDLLKNGGKKGIALQYAIGLFILGIGILLTLPFVPGPGFIFIILGLLLLQMPGTKKLVTHLDSKPGFHRFRNKLIEKYNIHLVY